MFAPSATTTTEKRDRTRCQFSANASEPRVSAYKCFAAQNLGAVGLCLTAQEQSGVPIKSIDFMGRNWRDNVNYVRSFGYNDD